MDTHIPLARGSSVWRWGSVEVRECGGGGEVRECGGEGVWRWRWEGGGEVRECGGERVWVRVCGGECWGEVKECGGKEGNRGEVRGCGLWMCSRGAVGIVTVYVVDNLCWYMSVVLVWPLSVVLHPVYTFCASFRGKLCAVSVLDFSLWYYCCCLERIPPHITILV